MFDILFGHKANLRSEPKFEDTKFNFCDFELASLLEYGRFVVNVLYASS